MPTPKAADLKQEKARERFQLAVLQLFEDDVPNNPLKVLGEEVWPAWCRSGQGDSAANVGAAGHRTFRYMAADALQKRAAEHRQNQRELVHDWARRMGLVNGSEPVKWICDWIETLFWNRTAELNGVRRGVTTIGGHVAIGAADSGRRPKLIGGFFVPMVDPDQRAGESEKDFKRRKRAALTAEMNAKPKRKPLAKQVEPDAAHSKWVILSICCKWPGRQVRLKYAPFVSTDQAIWQGVRREAVLLGITPTSQLS